MKKNYTHIVMLIDRSGSMQSIKADMEGALKAFLDDQKKLNGECTLTVAQFDDELEFLFNLKPLSEIEEIKIEPRSMTALLDSMCRLIDKAGAELATLDEENRPDRVLFITITDGGENASREFTNAQLSEKIKHQEENYKWNFTYLGANQDSFSVSQGLGISASYSKTMNYNASTTGSMAMYASLTSAVSRFRSANSSEVTQDLFAFTGQEQESTENAK